MVSYNTEKYHRRRSEAIVFLGGKCVRCGSTDALELDHVDPSTKSFSLHRLKSEAEWWAEVRKCQLLCHPCHKAKSNAEQTTRTHGTYAMYRRGRCHCALCKPVGDEYMRAAKRRHRDKKKAQAAIV